MIGPIVIETSSGASGAYDIREARTPFVSLADRFASGADSPRDHLERRLETIAARDNAVKAFCFVDQDSARAAADASAARWREGAPLSPIDGCVIGMKDTIDVAGMPSKMNCDIFDETPRAYDAASSHALREAGAIILGKTWVPELAMGKLPPTRNPFDPARTAGGSSSGCGAAVGADMLDVAIGNQTGGSLIRPSSFNANYGFKPSHGALNVAGMHPLAPSQDHIGPMARTLADAWATAFEISARAGGHDGCSGFVGSAKIPAAVRPTRLCWLRTSGWRDLDAPTRGAFEGVLGALDDQGVSVIDASSDDDVATLEELLLEADAISNDIIMYEVRWPLVAYMKTHGPEVLSETARHRLDRGLAMTPADYRRALSRRDAIRQGAAHVLRRVDAFVTLASSGPAPLVEDPSGGQGAGAHLKTGSRAFLSPWSMIGGPSMSLPLMSVDGMPLGLQIMGAPGRDRALVATAGWMDSST